MAEPRSRPSFARRIAAARPREKKYDVWDDTISGLGVCIYPSGARSFFLRRQLPSGRVRSVTLGSADRMTVPQARQEARRTLPALLDLPEKGQGPRYPGRPMDGFADEFLERHAQPRLRDPARDDVPRRGMGPARARHQSLSRHRQEPAPARRPLPRHRRTRMPRPRPRRPRGRMARGRRRHPAARAHRMPTRRSARPPMARHRRRRHEAARLEDWPAHGAARRGRAGACRHAARPAQPGRVPCFQAMPKAGVSGFSRTAGARSAPMRSSAGCGCTTCATPWPARP